MKRRVTTHGGGKWWKIYHLNQHRSHHERWNCIWQNGISGKSVFINVKNTYLTILSTTVLIWLEKQNSCRPSFSAVIETVAVVSLMCFARAWLSGSANCKSELAYICMGSLSENWCTHPKVNVQVSTSSYLVCHCHLGRMIRMLFAQTIRGNSTLSLTCKSSKKHSFLEAGMSIIWDETREGSIQRIESHSASVWVYIRNIVVEQEVSHQ